MSTDAIRDLISGDDSRLLQAPRDPVRLLRHDAARPSVDPPSILPTALAIVTTSTATGDQVLLWDGWPISRRPGTAMGALEWGVWEEVDGVTVW